MPWKEVLPMCERAPLVAAYKRETASVLELSRGNAASRNTSLQRPGRRQHVYCLGDAFAGQLLPAVICKQLPGEDMTGEAAGHGAPIPRSCGIAGSKGPRRS